MQQRSLKVRITHGDWVYGVHLTPDAPTDNFTLFVLAHGVSNNMDHPIMRTVAHGLVDLGHEVALFNFPFTHAGNQTPDPEPVLVGSLEFVARAAVNGRDVRLILGGKSLGARIAALTVSMGFQCDGLIFLGFPLHTPDFHSETRDELIKSVTRPMLFVQGTRDPFCHLDLLTTTLRQVQVPHQVHLVQGGEHSYVVKGRSMREIYEEIVVQINGWQAELA
ncbi:MAG: hypothetical protein P9M14_05415 [Candidatus Alcyoniella australis]|nr:hypothetical protein [Candidatus Alcyoniella australis]